MSQTILSIFRDRESASKAIDALQVAGYNPKQDISVIARDMEGSGTTGTTGEHVIDGAASGSATGAVVGGLAGLLIGIGALAIPGIGGLLIGGPLAAALGLTGAAATTVSGALTGALAGGLVGALVGLGVPEDEAKVYEERVKEGGVLVAVPVKDNNETMARNILENNGAEQISVVSNNA
jgi:uncharacterized membrane protein